MSQTDETCWTVILGAAQGRREDRSTFARRYESTIRAYLLARWRGSHLVGETDDATQEVFLDCFKEGGALSRADSSRQFRRFLFGVVRNVALRVEERRAKCGVRLPTHVDLPAREKSLSQAFDEAWARGLLRQAAERQRRTAQDERALRRVELLRLRFGEGLPIREIAKRWDVEAAHLHHEYATARNEFRAALRAVVAEHQEGTAAEIDRECARLVEVFE